MGSTNKNDEKGILLEALFYKQLLFFTAFKNARSFRAIKCQIFAGLTPKIPNHVTKKPK